MKLPISLIILLIFSFAAFAQQNRGGSKAVAENFSSVSIDGKSFELNSYRGKVVLLTFWSSKCLICHNEIPKLNKLAEDYRNKDVVFVGLTMNNSATVKAYIKDNPFNFKLIPDSFGVVLKYGDKDGDGRINMGFPAYFLINQKGEIELKTSGFDKTQKLNSEINRLLSEK